MPIELANAHASIALRYQIPMRFECRLKRLRENGDDKIKKNYSFISIGFSIS